jgi:hypothetical protein
MIGFKGFDKDFKCRQFQYEIGKTYEHDGDLSLCESGFHFCESPLDVFGYYGPVDSRFAEVEADSVSEKTDGDSKRVASKLSIKAEIGLTGLISAGVKFILERVNFNEAPATNTGDGSAATNTGDRSAATNTGDGSAATNTGDRSAATNTGDRSAATNTGLEGCAISLGIAGRASGAVGCWLTLAEWKQREGNWHRIDVQTRRVDGEEIKAETFYQLKDGRFVEAS